MKTQPTLLPVADESEITPELKLRIIDLAEAQIEAFGFSHTDDYCLYRQSGQADDPVRCAVGLFIPDKVYARMGEDIEGAGAEELCRNYYNPLYGEPNNAHSDFWSELQYAHDHHNEDESLSLLREALDELRAQVRNGEV